MNKDAKLPRIALIGNRGRTWKFKALKERLRDRYVVEIFEGEHLRQEEISKLQRFDLIFSKVKEEPALEILEKVEAHTRVINSIASVRLSKNRHRSLQVVSAQGVPVPRDYWGPVKGIPFKSCIVKNIWDDDNGFTPYLTTAEVLQQTLDSESKIYVQEVIPTEWEWKIYSIDGVLFGFRQRPTLSHPDKLSTREPIEIPNFLKSYVRRAIEAVGLEVGGVDFLGDGREVWMTDINSSQGLQNLPEAYAVLTQLFDRLVLS